MQRILRLFTPYRARIAAVVALMILASAIGLAGPFLLRAIIDIALQQQDLSLLVWLAGGMILAALASAGIGALQILHITRIGQAILHGLRVRLYAHLQTLSLLFFTGTRSGEVLARIAGDIARLQAPHTSSSKQSMSLG